VFEASFLGRWAFSDVFSIPKFSWSADTLAIEYFFQANNKFPKPHIHQPIGHTLVKVYKREALVRKLMIVASLNSLELSDKLFMTLFLVGDLPIPRVTVFVHFFIALISRLISEFLSVFWPQRKVRLYTPTTCNFFAHTEFSG
jgi:hypothetical protein